MAVEVMTDTKMYRKTLIGWYWCLFLYNCCFFFKSMTV